LQGTLNTHVKVSTKVNIPALLATSIWVIHRQDKTAIFKVWSTDPWEHFTTSSTSNFCIKNGCTPRPYSCLQLLKSCF